MDITIHVRDVSLDELMVKLDVIHQIMKAENQIMATLKDVQQRVQQNSSVIESAKLLIQGLKQKLDEAIASTDPNALQALADELAASDQALADAVAQNTPAAA